MQTWVEEKQITPSTVDCQIETWWTPSQMDRFLDGDERKYGAYGMGISTCRLDGSAPQRALKPLRSDRGVVAEIQS